MNRAQVKCLSHLVDQATPPPPAFWEEGDPRDEASVEINGYSGNDLEVTVKCYSSSLVRYRPSSLHITEAGTLCLWDEDALEADALVPCRLEWRYGDVTLPRERHYRICTAVRIKKGEST